MLLDEERDEIKMKGYVLKDSVTGDYYSTGIGTSLFYSEEDVRECLMLIDTFESYGGKLEMAEVEITEVENDIKKT